MTPLAEFPEKPSGDSKGAKVDIKSSLVEPPKEAEPIASEPPDPAAGLCSFVDAEFIGAGDGCDCPIDGDQSCDPDCATANGGEDECGCDFCFPDPADAPPPPPPVEVPPPGEPLCVFVPADFTGEQDGCDCPVDGDQSCDPDCATENSGEGSCGCDFCYDENGPLDEE